MKHAPVKKQVGTGLPGKTPVLNFRTSNIERSAERNRVARTSDPLDPMGSGRARKARAAMERLFPIRVAVENQRFPGPAGNRGFPAAAGDLLPATRIVEWQTDRPVQLAFGAG